MLRVVDEEKAFGFYRRGFDLSEIDRLAFDDFTLIFLSIPESEFELELTVNQGWSETYTRGSGYGCFAVWVADLEREHTRCAEQQLGPTPIKELQVGDKLAIGSSS